MPTLPEQPPDAPPPLVLIVDDNPVNIDLIATILDHEGCRIHPAGSGVQALACARDLQPELILLDVIMPGMDGFQVCEALKRDPSTQDISILFISCRGEVDDIARGLQAGALDYISKPFEPLELLARVRTHLELARRRRMEHQLITDLQAALDQVKQLSGLLPICARCKKVRDDQGFWQQVERYITAHSEATFSHGLCPDCIPIYFPDFKPATKATASGRPPSAQ